MNYASQAMVEPGGYTEVVILTISHALASSGEPVTLNGTAPAGITVSFMPSSPVQLSTSPATNVTLILSASATVTPANDTITINGASGTNTQTTSFTLRVVHYRVVMVHNTFSPSSLSVTVGSTVFWQNIDGPVSACGPGGSTGNGAHNVVFTTLAGVNSSTIKQFGIYSYTFNTAGSYFYYSSLDTDHLMNGTITVVAANGGGGMMPVSMPAFSYFKPSSAPAAASSSVTSTTTTVAAPVYGSTGSSQLAVGGVAFAGLAFLNAHSSVLSDLGFGAALAVLLSVAALGLAVAMSRTSKTRFTIMGAGAVESLSHPDSAQ